jgi:S1-C subfamily serine protease
VLVVVFLAAVLVGCGDGSVPAESRVEVAYHLEVEPCRGNLTQRASGVAIASDLVATVAHALVEAKSITVLDWTGQEVEAEVILLDEARDIALLRLGQPADRHARPVAPTETGPVEIVSFADPDGPVIQPGAITKLVDVTLDGEGRRAAANLSADIEPGDSGSAVFSVDGRLVAMVFASVRRADRGWAVSGEEIRRAVTRIDEQESVGLTCEAAQS